MKRFAWSLVVAGLMASPVLANEPTEVHLETGVECHVGECVVGECLKCDLTLVDPVPVDVDVRTLDGGVVADDQILMMSATGGIADSGPVDENEMHTLSLGGEVPANFRGGEQELSMNTAALGLPGLGDNRINLNAFGLFGEHRDSMRLAREGQTVTTRKVGLLHLFSKNKAKSGEATVRTVSTVEKARAQKLAEIDKLRDDALRTGDRAKLAQADKLEAQLNGAPAKTPSKFNIFRK
ncbi:MAG TPA: hypothetical protein VM165_01675 [Planctomycetaceae bacterium]|nr:hypothetical protein [Planctomycetaceae bacterium]